ncbi:hypothetical protein [Demequina sp.]|uniref:hypothetical protein n=1 Tax=Demequina sp. TaxID=2050685 RepID=UPI003A88C18A
MRFRYALSTLTGPWISLVVLGLDGAVAASRGAEYLGEDVWTVRWMALGLWILWPLVAAGAATDAARATAAGNRHLALPPEVGSRDYLWRAAWTAGPAMAAHVIVVMGALVAGGVLQPREGWQPLLLALSAQAVTIMFATALGSWIGRHVPVLLAGAVAGAAMLLAGGLLTNVRSGSPGFTFLGDTGASVTQVGVVWNPVHLWWQIALVGGATALLVIQRPQVRSGLVAPSVRSVGAIAVVAAVGIASPAFVPGPPLIASDARADECRYSTVVVCYFPEHREFVDATEASLSRLARAAKESGYDDLVPDSAVERSRRVDLANGTTIRSFGPLGVDSDQVHDVDVILDILTPTWCNALSGSVPPPDAFWIELEALAYTWASIAGVDEAELQQRFFDVDEVLEPADVSAIIDAHSRCDLDGVR